MFTFRLIVLILLTSAPAYATPLSLDEMKGTKFEANRSISDQAASFSKWLNLNAEDKKASIRVVLDSIHSSTPISDFTIDGINHCIVRQFTSGISLFDLVRSCDDPMLRPLEALQVCVIRKMFPLDPNISPAETMKDRSLADKIKTSKRTVMVFFNESLRPQGTDLQSFLNELISKESKEIAERASSSGAKSTERDEFFVKIVETMRDCDKIKDDK